MVRLVVGGVFLALVGMTFSNVAKEDGRWVNTDGKVLLIKRTCTFNVTETNRMTGKVMSQTTEEDSCSATDEFSDMRFEKNRARNIQGDARVSVAYKAADGSTELAALELNGSDDAFYTIRKGDKVKLKVSKADPSKVILAAQ